LATAADRDLAINEKEQTTADSDSPVAMIGRGVPAQANNAPTIPLSSHKSAPTTIPYFPPPIINRTSLPSHRNQSVD